MHHLSDESVTDLREVQHLPGLGICEFVRLPSYRCCVVEYFGERWPDDCLHRTSRGMQAFRSFHLLCFDILVNSPIRSPLCRARCSHTHSQCRVHVHSALIHVAVAVYCFNDAYVFLQVVDICVGTSIPALSNFRALPTPGGAIWPQVMLDIEYKGSHHAFSNKKRKGGPLCEFTEARLFETGILFTSAYALNSTHGTALLWWLCLTPSDAEPRVIIAALHGS